MMLQWHTEQALTQTIPSDQMVNLLSAIRRWVSSGYAVQEFRDSRSQPLIRIRQVGGTLLQDVRTIPRRVRLSRFTVMRQSGGELIVEQPSGNSVVSCIDPRAAMLVALLAKGVSAEEVTNSGLDLPDIQRIMAVLVASGIAGEVNDLDCLDEENNETLRPWAWHDVATHFRSRRGNHRYPAHGSYHLKDKQAPEPGIKAPMSERIIELPTVDIDALRITDMSLTEAIEERFAGRDHSDAPLTLNELGELLFRSARVRWYSAQSDVLPYDHTSRPYPTGGATYDLEIYVTIAHCDGIEPGFYHYEPDRHVLEFLTPPTEASTHMLLDAHYATAGLGTPQILLTVTSRFARISWKYEGMAYATTLRNVGAFYQTIWLVATAMGIACCPLGGGDVSAFAAASGIDPMSESNVGEVMLGKMSITGARGNRTLDARQ
ncbi:MAG: SagB family peptide dehydrogenase, partial [Planctomycetota bacterium]|nr:SagB family peptide dehydrogenase [Planctomycetota bacterium]